MDGPGVELEICANCKKEIPHYNYVMHTAHCARNISLCPKCKEPIPKNQFDDHKIFCTLKPSKSLSSTSTSTTSSSSYLDNGQLNKFFDNKQNSKSSASSRNYDRLADSGNPIINQSKTPPIVTSPITNGTSYSKQSSNTKLIACKYCELELPKLELDEHENYCGSRTDKCLECGELVMFKYKQIHMDSNHGFLKLKDEPGPRASWDSNTHRSISEANIQRHRPPPLRPFSGFDSTLYSFPTTYSHSSSSASLYSNPINGANKEKSESYKEISRRLDCKTEYIRNLLHDSASITVPLRHNGAVPRNHFNHNKGPAPQPPLSNHHRKRNPPTELTIPCEFCDTPIPHNELIQHERDCRPERFRRGRSPELDDYFVAPQPNSPDVELPCEFCADMIPASQLLRHQATCN